jgi:hypothetical protein
MKHEEEGGFEFAGEAINVVVCGFHEVAIRFNLAHCEIYMVLGPPSSDVAPTSSRIDSAQVAFTETLSLCNSFDPILRPTPIQVQDFGYCIISSKISRTTKSWPVTSATSSWLPQLLALHLDLVSSASGMPSSRPEQFDHRFAASTSSWSGERYLPTSALA